MTIIAEIGTAHSGSIEKAYKLIDAASDAGADCVKFQWVYADEILHPDTGFVKLPTGNIRLYDRFKELEVDSSFFAKCRDYAHEKGLLFACSPFGLHSLKELVEIKPDAIKIASPEVNHYPLLEETARYYGKIPIILSSGVSKLGDLEKAIEILESKNTADLDPNANLAGCKLPPLTVLHCITFYPAPENEYNVLCVDTLRRVFGIPSGISDHSLDEVLVPVLSTAVGGTMIEKHITLSRKTDGLDDPVALEGSQFAHMVHCVHQTQALVSHCKKDLVASDAQDTLRYKEIQHPALEQTIAQLSEQYDRQKITEVLGNGIKRLAKSEIANYGRTNRSLHYMHDMKKGEIIKDSDISVLRTEKILTPGITPDFMETVIGSRLQKDISKGAGVDLKDFICK